jgi:hypothetical protein
MEKNARLVNRGPYTHIYKVTGCVFMTKEQILDFCDGNNFGGNVYVNAKGEGMVEVYID